MGISPAAIAGTSVGAIVGGAYAAGIKGRAIWNHLLRVLSNRSDVMGKLLRARMGRFADLVLLGRGNPVLLDVWSRPLMGHPYRVIRRMRYGPSSAWERHDDCGDPSSDTA